MDHGRTFDGRFRRQDRLLILTRFLPQISLRNLRKLDCYANRCPLRSKTLWKRTGAAKLRGRLLLRLGALGLRRRFGPALDRSQTSRGEGVNAGSLATRVVNNGDAITARVVGEIDVIGRTDAAHH